MLLKSIRPAQQIAPFIHHFWVFEADGGLPAADARVVVPNGRPKLIVPWRNGLTAGGTRTGRDARQGQIVLVGVWDQPTTLSSAPERTVTIGVEFTATGLSRFLRMDLAEISSQIAPLDEVLDGAGSALIGRVGSAETLEEAVDLVHGFLLERFAGGEGRPEASIDAAVSMMRASEFSMPIEEIALHLGCSRRHLSELFRQRVGVSPKRLQAILAFERLYRRYAAHRDLRQLRDDALDHFHDQSHFIHAFRRFTGLAPTRFAEMENEFGRIFYRTEKGA